MIPEISLVIPIYNEAPNIEALYGEITAALDPWAWPLLALWPLLVIGAEEARKAALRHGSP